VNNCFYDYETVILFLGNIYFFPAQLADFENNIFFSASTNASTSKLFHLCRQGKYDVRSSWELIKEQKGKKGNKKKKDKFSNKG
jgi:hypothetical protein